MQSLPKSNAVEDLFRVGNGCGVLETEPSAAVGDAVSANPVYQPDRQPERFRGLSTSGHVDSLDFFLSASCAALSGAIFLFRDRRSHSRTNSANWSKDRFSISSNKGHSTSRISSFPGVCPWRRANLSPHQLMLTEIACGPISGPATLEEIPFICSLFLNSSSKVSVMYGVACKTDNDRLWVPFDIVTATLPEWIERSIQDGVYEPGNSDIFIFDKDRLTVRLCHEADIHIETSFASIIQMCAHRWLVKRYRLLRSEIVPPSSNSWREIHSVEEATAGLLRSPP